MVVMRRNLGRGWVNRPGDEGGGLEEYMGIRKRDASNVRIAEGGR